MKGIAREVVPYEFDGVLDEKGAAGQVFSEHTGRLQRIESGCLAAGCLLYSTDLDFPVGSSQGRR
jgi:hypothetical protein